MKKLALVSILVVAVSGTVWAADEITLSVLLKAVKGNASVLRNPATEQIDWNGSRFFSSTFSSTTNWQPFSKGSVDTNGIVFVRNMSTNVTQYLSFDVGVTTNLAIKGSEFFIFRYHDKATLTNLHYKAASGTPDIELTILED